MVKKVTKSVVKRLAVQKDINFFDREGLPPELLKQIKKPHGGTSGIASMVYGLFNHKDELDANDIIVGTYRKHDVLLKRAQVVTAINFLVKKGKIEKNEHGLYQAV
jgi:hypothetical protein